MIEELKDTEQFVSSDNEINQFLKLQFKGRTRTAYYRVILTKSLTERENLVTPIAWSFLLIKTVFVLSLFFINRLISKIVWKPFYFILQQLHSFNLEKGDYTRVGSKITEFNELNAAIESMTQKAKNDYRNLKEFTENASHEIQTPFGRYQG